MAEKAIQQAAQDVKQDAAKTPQKDAPKLVPQVTERAPRATVEEAQTYFKMFEFTQLRMLQSALSEEIRSREKDAIQKAKAEIRKIAESMGMTPEALLAVKTPKPPVVAGPKSPGRGIYRHPENPMLEWKGMGPHPSWLKELLASGKTFESLRVAA